MTERISFVSFKAQTFYFFPLHNLTLKRRLLNALFSRDSGGCAQRTLTCEVLFSLFTQRISGSCWPQLLSFRKQNTKALQSSHQQNHGGCDESTSCWISREKRSRQHVSVLASVLQPLAPFPRQLPRCPRTLPRQPALLPPRPFYTVGGWEKTVETFNCREIGPKSSTNLISFVESFRNTTLKRKIPWERIRADERTETHRPRAPTRDAGASASSASALGGLSASAGTAATPTSPTLHSPTAHLELGGSGGAVQH